MPSMTDHRQIIDIAEDALQAIGDRKMLTQGYSVDVLLDLYFATDEISIRWAIAERLDDIRLGYSVEAADLRADLTAIIEIATADATYDLRAAA